MTSPGQDTDVKLTNLRLDDPDSLCAKQIRQDVNHQCADSVLTLIFSCLSVTVTGCVSFILAFCDGLLKIHTKTPLDSCATSVVFERNRLTRPWPLATSLNSMKTMTMTP